MSSPPTKRTAAVTGATGTIGRAITRGLVEQNFHVVMITRNPEKSRQVREEIISETGIDSLEFVLADLSRHQSIRDLQARWEKPLHVLINNAAVTPPSRKETPEGIELQWATNVLGYYWMITEFHPVLQQSGTARVVNVASYWAGGLDLSDPEFKERPYTNGAAYRQSKQADRMLSQALAQQYQNQGIVVNSCHPGDVPSNLSRNLGFGGHESPEKAASTPLWLAVSPEAGRFTGQYVEDKSPTSCPFAADQEQVHRLLEILRAYP